MDRQALCAAIIVALTFAFAPLARAQEPSPALPGTKAARPPVAASPAAPGPERLVSAYASAIDGIDGNELVLRSGGRIAIDDHRGHKSHQEWFTRPDIKDMFALAYPVGAPLTAPPLDFDPGRARPTALFEKLYGDCQRGEVEPSLRAVVWLPKKFGKVVLFSGKHGAAAHLNAVSKRLDELPAKFDKYLLPPAGTYNCRTIAGTSMVSAHGYGIAIDLATAYAHYWRWSPASGGKPAPWENEFPKEIVDIFEAEGFIWGGRWSHFDTMHFEYRPEMFALK